MSFVIVRVARHRLTFPSSTHPPKPAASQFCRLAALTEMQRLADDALSREHAPLFSPLIKSAARRDQQLSSTLPFTATSKDQYLERSKESSPGEEAENEDEEEVASAHALSKLLACWRGEVLKLLVEKGTAKEVSAQESREAARQVLVEQEMRTLAQTEAKV